MREKPMQNKSRGSDRLRCVQSGSRPEIRPNVKYTFMGQETAACPVGDTTTNSLGSSTDREEAEPLVTIQISKRKRADDTGVSTSDSDQEQEEIETRVVSPA